MTLLNSIRRARKCAATKQHNKQETELLIVRVACDARVFAMCWRRARLTSGSVCAFVGGRVVQRAEHNATNEAINASAQNPDTHAQNCLLTVSLQLWVGSSLSNRNTQTDTDTQQQCCLTVGSKSTTCREVRHTAE